MKLESISQLTQVENSDRRNSGGGETLPQNKFNSLTHMYKGEIAFSRNMADMAKMMWGGLGAAIAVVTIVPVSNVVVSWITGGRWTVSKAADDLEGRCGL